MALPAVSAIDAAGVSRLTSVVTAPQPYDEARPDVWTWLQSWYVAQCDGDWEHEFGVEIGTLDNPGWRVSIDLSGTALADAEYSRTEVHRSSDDWCVTWVDAHQFHAACGPTNLGEALDAFRTFAAR